MIKARLTDDCLWRGVLYERGDRLIPDDFAAALGLANEAKSATVSDSEPKSATVADLPEPEPEPPPPEPPPKSTTKKRRGG